MSNQTKKKTAVKFDDYALLSIVFFLILVTATGNFQASLTLTLVIDGAVFVIASGKVGRIQDRIRPLLIRVKIRLWDMLNRKKKVSPDHTWDVFLGFAEATGKPIIHNLERLQSVLVAGSTGFGKSTWLQETIDYMLTTHDPDDLRLVLCDRKAVSTSPWRNVPHLLLPIAHTKEEHALAMRYIIEEMERRREMFQLYSDDFCESLDDYMRLSGDRMPRIVVIIDELMASIHPKDDAYADLVRIANIARYVGITLIIGTQRPSAKVITGELLNSMVTKIFGYMPNTREYSLVSMIPPEVYGLATPTPGRFMVYTVVGQWQMMTVERTDRQEMAARARKIEGRLRHRTYQMPTWDDLRTVKENKVVNRLAEKTEWSNSMTLAEKAAMVRAWGDTLEKPPRTKEIIERYGISKPTAINIRKLAYPELYE